MKKLRMKSAKSITFEEGCNKYLEYCRQRNLREGTINHYRQSYVQFFKFLGRDTPIIFHFFDPINYLDLVIFVRTALVIIPIISAVAIEVI